nr:hypothetical protein [Mimivirus sp.]URM62529.1 hypothetical protein [Mimivirus sp.]
MTSFDNLINILQDGIIYPNKYLPKKSRVLSGSEQNFVYTNMFIDDYDIYKKVLDQHFYYILKFCMKMDFILMKHGLVVLLLVRNMNQLMVILAMMKIMMCKLFLKIAYILSPQILL